MLNKKKAESSKRRAFTPDKRLFFLVSGIVLIGVSLVCLFYVVRSWEESKSAEAVSEALKNQDENGPALVYEGTGYDLKDNVETTLIMGIDKNSDNDQSEANLSKNYSQCDFLTLLVTDKTTGQSRMILLNRDTMVDVDRLTDKGEKADTQKMQLALAHSYGSGEKDISRNAMRSVSRLFSNAPIDHFVTLTMDAVPALNDAVGGVPVLVEEDFSEVDPTLVQGETITLEGQHALNNSTNEEIMARQQKYMDSFYDTLKEAMENGKVDLMSLLTNVSPYMTSDLSVTKLNDIFTKALENSDPDMEVIPGQSVLGEKYIELYPDEKALMDKTISLFFTPAKK